MDKTIVSIGGVLVGLGVGFIAAIQIMPDLHSAYLIGGYMWVVLGAITMVLGLKKQERLGIKREISVSTLPKKSAIGI